VRIGSGDIEVTVLPAAGARMHSLRVRGRELLRTPDDPAEHLRDPFFWGGYVMAPWCNRVAPGQVAAAGKMVDLAANFRDGSAIHGQVYAATWQQLDDGTFAIERDGDGWPWRYRVSAEYLVDGQRLGITLHLHNLSDEPMPGGIGIHPWFPLPVEARIACAETYGPNEQPLLAPVPVTGDLDLRSRQALAEGVDSTWTQPADPPIELWWPHESLHATIRAPFPTLHVTAAYAADLGAIAVEPQTHAPQGLSRLINAQPGAIALIQPGDALVLPITIDFEWMTSTR